MLVRRQVTQAPLVVGSREVYQVNLTISMTAVINNRLTKNPVRNQPL